MGNLIRAMSKDDLSVAIHIENMMLDTEQIKLYTNHTIHSGVYYRTIKLNSGEALTGALIKIPTTLIISGHIKIYIGKASKEIKGYDIIPANANRKQVIVAVDDTYVTMAFRTDATTVEEAEEEFTDEANRLMSRSKDAVNIVNITDKELKCQE